MYTHLKNDNQVYEILQLEKTRQQDKLELIASENFVSPAVLEAAGRPVLPAEAHRGHPGVLWRQRHVRGVLGLALG